MTTRNRLSLLAIILFLFCLGSLVLLPVPFTRDQGIYAYNAWRWLDGGMFYRDSFGHKGPLLYLIYAAALKLSSGAMWGPNLADILARAAAIIFVYAAGRQLLSGRAALLAALFTALPLFGVFNSCWWNAQAETFMLPLMACSAWLVAWNRERLRLPLILAAGLIAAQAVAIKPTAAAHALFLFCWLLVPGPRETEGGRWKAPAAFAAGGLIGISGWLVYLAARGALGPMWEFLIVFNSFHAESRVLGTELWSLAQRGFWPIFNLLPVLALFLLFRRQGEGRRAAAFTLGWFAASVLQIGLQFKFFLYHWLVLIPPMALAAGAGLDTISGAASRWFGRWTGRAILAIVAAWFIFVFGRCWILVEESYQTREYLLHRITLAQYYARFNAGDAFGKGDFNMLASAAAADYVRKNTPPEARVLVFGYEPIVNVLSARPAPGRFEIDYPLTFTPPSARARRYRDQWRAQFMADLHKTPPALVILLDNDINSLELKTSIEQAQEFTEFRKWLNLNYKEGAVIEDFHFYSKK
ncbi:MAG TPA: glycosyltransferase family 39 protein [bacterium]|nr:glycosyltransferase family 39 protein [bacterium]